MEHAPGRSFSETRQSFSAFLFGSVLPAALVSASKGKQGYPSDQSLSSGQANTMYFLTDWEGRTGKYLARGQGVRTERSELRTYADAEPE